MQDQAAVWLVSVQLTGEQCMLIAGKRLSNPSRCGPAIIFGKCLQIPREAFRYASLQSNAPHS